jgi:group I intron endonuclease
MIGVYKITSPTYKIYIGQSRDIEKRFKHYLGMYKCTSSQRILYNSFIKHGVKNHVFEIIEHCDFELLNERERYWQDFYDVLSKKGMNCILTETKLNTRVISKETRDKISKANKGKFSGKNNPNYGKLGKLNPFFGRKHTEETKKKLSENNKGINHIFYGKKRPEHSIKISGVNHYNFGKKNEWISLMNKKRLGLNHSRSKIYLDINYGVYYYSTKDYCDTYKIDTSTFRYRFKTNKINNLILV